MAVNDPRRWAAAVLFAGVVVWLAISNGSLTREGILFFAVLIPSVIVHEVAHGVVALAFGDDTAKRAGRLTANPVAHVDPFWTLLLPAMLVLVGAPVIGMAKPVPVNARKMRSPRNQSLLTALAGPATNIVLSLVAAALFRLMRPPSASWAFDVLLALGLVNVFLAVFNLLPLPPLDGSAVIERFVPVRWLNGYLRVRRYSFLILFALFFLASDVFGRIMDPAVDLWFRLLV